MAKEFKPVVVTANDLIEGDSVFLSAQGWVRDIARAHVAYDADAAQALEADGLAGETANIVIGPYLVEVLLATGHPVPVLRREQIRADGVPTIPVGLDAQPVERAAA
ncbi:MAG: DUF2849 domain-containing protein [Paracoccaceae bacterium]|nr:DUF2849 domain-containing protein [Paracoccaceae bacterium]